MVKSLFFNIVFVLGLTIATEAANESAITVSDVITTAANFGKEKPKGFTAETKNVEKLNNFSLGSKMQFKGDKVIDNKINYLNFNTSITYQKGENSYIVPFKKAIILNRITFNPNEMMRDRKP